MNKKIVENIGKTLPYFFKEVVDTLKDNFNNNGKKIFENVGGTVGVITRLFAQPLIDKYFDNLSTKKLSNYGLNVYVKASINQANESLKKVECGLDQYDVDAIIGVMDISIAEEISAFNKNDMILIFQPEYHPAVVFIKNNYQRILTNLEIDADDISIFIKDFNEKIAQKIKEEFGDNFEKHQEEISGFITKENETHLLWETIQQAKIGFKERENLKYENTYAEWEKVYDLRESGLIGEQEEDDNLSEQEAYEKHEHGLKNIETLIENYFSSSVANSLEKILFVIADFGKGKSVFVKHYAAELAKLYLKKSEGYFPIYFNLRNFKNYSSEHHLGVIGDYLETKYGIKINDEYFQNKKYVFLVDSLDESGDLNRRAIDKVIASVKNIQNIDKTKYRTNRIIITSRPFDEGLSNHLNDHEPFLIKNEDGRDVPYYISIYGFTKEQFNDWLYETLTLFPTLKKIQASGFAREIISAVLEKRKIDIYNELLKTNTLSKSELRRPIFAYMIYQLILNNVDFLEVGKIGVYLSFLNLLTKEAKHIHDATYMVNLKEEFEFRNILHATAALWMYERQNGKQGILNKADICRVLQGKNTGETDTEILERFKGQGLTEIQFLSHSYFGENNNLLHFQHQSFAEILLAEYYLKIFIKYALDENIDIDEARIKLSLGEPTQQTVLFLREMLQLLRDTTTTNITKEIIEKRKLLFPLMASLAAKKNQCLFCNDIYYSWYKNCNIEENYTEYPLNSLENWCIDDKRLTKIIELSSIIINSKNSYLSTQASSKTALFSSEVLEVPIQFVSSITQNIDKWLSLLVGNILYNDLTVNNNLKIFNKDFKINFHQLFEMMSSWNYTNNEPAPFWGKNLFIGLDMSSNDTRLDLSTHNFDGIDFSYSYFKSIRTWGTNWSRCKFIYCSFSDVHFITSLFYFSIFQHIVEISPECFFSNCEISPGGIKLLDLFDTTDMNKMDKGITKSHWRKIDVLDNMDIFHTIAGFVVYGLERSLFTIDDIKARFEYEDDETKNYFNKRLDSLNIK